jgi:hypothetical protein
MIVQFFILNKVFLLTIGKNTEGYSVKLAEAYFPHFRELSKQFDRVLAQRPKKEDLITQTK